MMQYCEITGLWSARVPDGPDSDQYPDTVLLEGHVTFEPEYRVPLVYPGEHIVVEPLHAVIHEGVLYGETVVGDDVVRGPLFLPVTVDEDANQTWAWVAKFQGMRLGEYGEEVALPNVRFQVPAGDDALDLSTVIPASQSDGTITLRGPRGYGITGITAESGVVTVEWEGGDNAIIPIPTAALATPTSDGLMPQGDKAKLDEYPAKPMGVRYDTTAGTAVYVSDGTTERLVSYDSGWRNIWSLVDQTIFVPSASNPRMSIRQTLGLVELLIRANPGPAIIGTPRAGHRNFISALPAGWRQDPVLFGPLGVAEVSSSYISFVNTSGAAFVGMRAGSGTWDAGDRVVARLAWSVARTAPATLPGIPDQ